MSIGDDVQTFEATVTSQSAPPRGRKREVFADIEDALFLCLMIGLAAAPFYLGSNRSLAWGLNALYFGVLAAAFEIALLVTRRRRPVAARRLILPILAFAVVSVLLLVQSTDWTPNSRPDAWSHPIWQMTRQSIGGVVRGAISIDPGKTSYALTRFATAACVFWLAVQLGRSSLRARRLVAGTALIGLAYAAYGLIAFFAFPTKLLWFDKLYYLESVTSTFVNRNSYATYAGIGLVAMLGWTISHYLRRVDAAGRAVGHKIAAAVAVTIGQGGLLIPGLFIIGVALMLTGSRGGIMATGAGVATFALLSVLRGRRYGVGVSFPLLAAGLAIAAPIFTFDRVLAGRLTDFGFDGDDRLAADALTLRAVGDSPFIGYGDGGFQETFAIYRDSTIGPGGIWEKAHNTYVETLLGIGVPASALLFLVLGLLVGRCVYGALTRKTAALAPLTASVSSVLVALHAFVDFSLQMQAVTLTWAALLGAGVAQSWSGRVATDR